MAQQQFPPNYNYMPQPMQSHQNGQQTTNNFVNGFPQMAPSAQQQQQQQVMAPQPKTINYQNFQTNALAASGINGSNSALSSRTSSPGVQAVPASQLPPSKSYPSYQHLQQQQAPLPMNPITPQIPQVNSPMPPSQQFAPVAQPAPVNNNNNENNQASNQNLSASMRSLNINNPVTTFPSTPSMPTSKSDQNLLNNNNMQQQPMKPLAAMQKRPMYPQGIPPMPQQSQQPQQQPVPQQQPMMPQNQAMSQPQFNSFPGIQQPTIQPNVPQQQPRANLQYQNIQQQPQQTQPGIVNQGFNRMWGRETVDLLQNRHILPQTKILPPSIKLNHQFHEAANCGGEIFRCTLTKIPESNSLLQKSRLPLGILIHPYRDLSVSLSATLINFFFKNFFLPSESSRYQLLEYSSLSRVSHLHKSIRILRR